MEPMTLGSPVGSPVTPQMSMTLFTGNNLHGTMNTPTNPYYPSYLMGETQNSRVPAGSISPGRPSRQFSTPVNANISSPSSPQISRETYFPNTRLGGDRPGGPPTLSLMGGLPQSPSSRIQSTSFVDHQKIISSPYHISQSQNYNSPLPSSHHAAQPGTPFTSTSESFLTNSVVQLETHLREPLEDSWVTVFGFPVASASYILTQFAHLGTIVDQRLPGIGNWMHLKYQTKLQARKALTKHSKIFSGNIMIGVVPCNDPTINVEKENVSLNFSSVMSPRDPRLCSSPQTPKAHIRPLTQAYQASRADIEITPTPNTPKKNDSFVAKAMQHILGV